MRIRYQIALLFLLALAFYLPGLQAGYFIFDDQSIVESLRINGLDAIRLFPGESSNYLRPLVMLSFLVDVHFWNAHPGVMHLENLLLHAANATLVFFIVRTLVAASPERGEWRPFLASLLFLLHPTTTESVNWIAGRSDILAALFVLAGFWLLIQAVASRREAYAFWAAIVMFGGSLAKEVAFFALPGAIAILLFCHSKHVRKPLDRAWRLRSSLPFLVGILVYSLLRTRMFSGFDQGTASILEGNSSAQMSLPNMAIEGVTALGFYFKKLLVPWPLNFAIDQVSPLYFWVGLVGVVVFTVLLARRDLRAGALLLLVLGIAPALLNALFQIAWTNYAERYLYLPAAFLAIALLAKHPDQTFGRWLHYGLVALLLTSFLPLTTYRNLQWDAPFEILAEARRHNPDNLTLHNNYAIALTDHSGPKEGRKEFMNILAIDPDNRTARRNLAKIALYVQDDPQQAKEDLDIYFTKKKIPDAKMIALMNQIREKCRETGLACQ